MPDLDAYAREFYNEIRALSMDTGQGSQTLEGLIVAATPHSYLYLGGSMADILENIGASSESLSSLIPHEKREELASFEMSLKQMIDEAKMLAESQPPSVVASCEDISKYRRSSDAKTPVEGEYMEGWEEKRSRKSFSHPESVVSVIDTQEQERADQRMWEEEQEMLRQQEEEQEMLCQEEEQEMLRQEEEEQEILRQQQQEMRRRRSAEETEPVPMSRRVVTQPR